MAVHSVPKNYYSAKLKLSALDRLFFKYFFLRLIFVDIKLNYFLVFGLI